MNIAERVRLTMNPPLTGLMAEARRRVAEGRDVIPLGQAVVDYQPPAAFLRALGEGLRNPDLMIHRYTPDPGLPELRQALGRYLDRSFGLTADPSREILVTPGANQAAFTAISAILDPGDEALLLAPYYFNHEMMIRLAGGRPRVLDGSQEAGFIPSIEQLQEAWSSRLRALFLVHPGNPTGVRIPARWIQDLAGLMATDKRWRDIWLIADQTYQDLCFDGESPLSPASLPGMRERTLTAGSFSKSMALAGWRLGFLAGPAPFLEEALKIQDSSVICAAHPSQYALSRTLDDPELEGYLEEKRGLLRRRRDALLEPLQGDGRLRVRTPEGACFAFVGLPESIDSAGFARELLETQDVAVVPGEAFGPSWSSYLRLGFGHLDADRLAEGAGRILEQLDITAA